MSGLRSPLNFANTVDYEAIKRHAFHDQNIVIVRLDDPKLSWADREMLRAVGERLYGAPKPAGR
ncbi:hypothetical protein EN883_03540 [Mesorhizobium sp. M7A.F.Ca.AU.002.06.1.1]|nr:hypothetical protein EOC84_03625 [Mesorhizobium sp. Primo-B]RUU37880.1 hypothetical protein EOC83_16590 [Mesorhizobium sp. Primo-A]RVB69321.1 hypothetical protein EN895_00670 [Mesorhizobium sp. M7A.F.Ca.CA.002.03.2.1]RVB90969.1 hypothetical protein EN880_08100 [Mesorhizobium sp. M7A.F.Ca.AU.002.03.1.1]RVB95919.1 hypothetical protein EN881_05585 [Mesorhizobium sp. M7A.F.Ca.AU.002.04.1.1]RVC05742.1 hypothetical protein EN883_03540 [Mesorhizobium sp. M7A.F.Ca.AU.002.06.1.1]RVC18733.1 hypothet